MSIDIPTPAVRRPEFIGDGLVQLTEDVQPGVIYTVVMEASLLRRTLFRRRPALLPSERRRLAALDAA